MKKSKFKNRPVFIVISVLLIICFFIQSIFSLNVGFDDKVYLIDCLTYPFFHANIFHLLSSIYTLYLILYVTKRNIFWLLFYSIVIAIFVVPNFTAMESPTVGFSGMLYVMIGYSIQKFEIKNPFWITTIIFFVIGFLIPNINAFLHIYCFIGGLTVSIVYKFLTDIRNDYQRVSR